MQNSDLNQFVKYDQYSSYLTKTQVKYIDTRNPLDYYKQNNISTQNWDSNLLQTQPKINTELDKISNLVDSLFIKNDSQPQLKQEPKERNQKSFFEKSSHLGNFLSETSKSIDLVQQQQQVYQSENLMNLRPDVLNVKSVSTDKMTNQLGRQKSNVDKLVEKKGLNYKQSAPLTLHELRQINNIEIQKALKVLQK